MQTHTQTVKTEDQPPLTDMLCFALYSATHAMHAAYKPLLDGLGLTYPQYLVLVSLWGRDDQTVGTLGVALHLDSNTLTPLLKRMATAGLLTRQRDSIDERQVRIRLTDQGRLLQQHSSRLTDCIFRQSGLDMPGLVDLQTRIIALRDHLRPA